MKNLIDELSIKLSNLEDNDGEVIINTEYDIDDSIIHIKGSLCYTVIQDNGDYYTAPHTERKLNFADLKITVFTDENIKILTNQELEQLYESL